MPTARGFAANEERVDAAALESWRCPRQRAFSAFLLQRDRGSVRFGGMPRRARPAINEVCIPFALASVQEYER